RVVVQVAVANRVAPGRYGLPEPARPVPVRHRVRRMWAPTRPARCDRSRATAPRNRRPPGPAPQAREGRTGGSNGTATGRTSGFSVAWGAQALPAQMSRSVTLRLNTGRAGVWSRRSALK